MVAGKHELFSNFKYFKIDNILTLSQFGSFGAHFLMLFPTINVCTLSENQSS